jgi:hypothetical protein
MSWVIQKALALPQPPPVPPGPQNTHTHISDSFDTEVSLYRVKRFVTVPSGLHYLAQVTSKSPPRRDQDSIREIKQLHRLRQALGVADCCIHQCYLISTSLCTLSQTILLGFLIC